MSEIRRVPGCNGPGPWTIHARVATDQVSLTGATATAQTLKLYSKLRTIRLKMALAVSLLSVEWCRVSPLWLTIQDKDT